ncbi:hypothetical protein ACHAPT_011077 [Fusarium lateritium]
MATTELTGDQPETESMTEYGRHVFHRGTDLDLRRILDQLSDETRYLHLYCVNLDYSCQPNNGHVCIALRESSKLRHIHIFACTFLNRAGIRSFSVTTPGQLKLSLYYETVPPKLAWVQPTGQSWIIARDDPEFDVNIAHLREAKTGLEAGLKLQVDSANSLSLNKLMVGVRITYLLDGSKLDLLDRIPEGELRWGSLFESFKAGSSTSTSPALENMGSLLNHVFAQACSLVFEGLGTSDSTRKETAERKATEYLSYVCRCTNYSPGYSALREDAHTLLERLEQARRHPSPHEAVTPVGKYTAPIECHSYYRKRLDDALNRCEGAQGWLNNISLATMVTQEFKKDNAKLTRALSAQSLGTISNDANYDKMVASSGRVYLRMEEIAKRKDKLLQAQFEFKKQLEKYQEAKKLKRDRDIFFGVVEIGWSLVVALATNPAAAVPTVADIASTVQKVVLEVVSGATDTPAKPGKDDGKDDPVARVKHIAGKVGPTVLSAGSKIYNAWAAYKNNELLRNEAHNRFTNPISGTLDEAVSFASKSISSSSPRIDFFGLMADWAEIKVQVEQMFIEIKRNLVGETIPGLEDYHMALSNMIVRGQALIEAQRQYQDDMGAYFRGVAENALREKRAEAITTAANEIEAGRLPIQDYVDTLKSRMVVLKRNVVLALHQYLLSLKYRSSRFNGIAIATSSEMSIDGLRNAVDHVDVQMSKTSAGSQNEQDVASIDLATEDEEENIFPLAWKDWLTELKQIPFTIPPSHTSASRFYDVRTRKISAQFLRQDGTPFENVKYDIFFGPVFIDRDSENRLHQYYTSEFNLVKTGDSGEWLAANQPIEDAKILPAMFSSGSIEFNYVDDKALKRIKLGEVSKVILTFTVRGMPIPKANFKKP